MTGSSRTDVFSGEEGNDTLLASNGADTINDYYSYSNTEPDDDWVEAKGGDDEIASYRGNDTIFGGSGIDRVILDRNALTAGQSFTLVEGGRCCATRA